MKTQLAPFTENMIPAAGNLLAQRHKRNRTNLPLLPSRFEDSSDATKAVEALWKKKFKNGYAAFRNGKMTAYLLGDFTIQPWARCGYVCLPGYALAEGESVEVIQDLYAMLGDDWVKKGVFSHYLYISTADTHVIEALFTIGFGKERVDALLDLRRITDIPEVEAPLGVTIRRAGKGDNDHLASLSDIIFRALANAPYWHPILPETWEELREGWAELADDEEWTMWLAFEYHARSNHEDQALGTVGFHAQDEDAAEMLVSPRTVTLSVGVTKPQARGRGINTALVWRGLAHMQKEGFEICHADWISPNLLASRFWPRFGFTDVAYRLAKRIDPMITWTKG